MSTRTRACGVCHTDFTYTVGKGKDRKHCSAACRIKHKAALLPARLAALPRCSVEACERPATRRSANLCEKHYYRRRRTGRTAAKAPAYRYNTGRGYVKLLDPQHPLADAGGYVLEHRSALYAAIGEGPHPCFWCGTVLPWRAIVVDHLNEDKADNRRTNLVASCNDCNLARGGMLPFVARLTDEALPAFLCALLAYRATPEAATIALRPPNRYTTWQRGALREDSKCSNDNDLAGEVGGGNGSVRYGGQ